MAPLQTLTSRLSRSLHWLPPQRGYVGIDIGSRSVKLVQVERGGEQWEIAAKWSIPLPELADAPSADWLDKAFESIRHELMDLRGIFAGRQVALTLPASLTSLRCMEMPGGTEQEMRAMVQDELCDDFAGQSEFTFDVWEMSSRSNGGNGTRHVAAFSTRSELSSRAAEGLLAAGYECQILDAVPCALARCAQLAAPTMAAEPSVALDLGYYSPQMVVCRNGRPSFCRSLPDCGLQSLTQPLRERLKLSERECQQLLTRLGICSSAPGASSSAATRAVSQLLAPKLAQLVNEVERTLAYIGQQFRDQKPKRVWLFGGGARIGNLADLLSARLGIPVEPWHAARMPAHADSASFAVAAALSLLAWEDQRCT